jgi:hypothetical protein
LIARSSQFATIRLTKAGADGKPVRFPVTIDGVGPGESHGADVNADGEGVVTDHRLYQLVRQNELIVDRTFTIQFLDPDVQAYAFTFGDGALRPGHGPPFRRRFIARLVTTRARERTSSREAASAMTRPRD